MSKRRNENGQMRREDYEAENDCDGESGGEGGFEGGFQRAPEEAIVRRKIVTARVGGKRQRPAAPPPATAAAPKLNAFAGFKGLVSTESSTRANPFSGFSGLTGAAPQPASTLKATTSTQLSAPSSATAHKTSPTTFQEAIEVLNNEFMEFVTQQLKANPSSDWSAAANDYAKHAQDIGIKFASTKPITAAARVTSFAAARQHPSAPAAFSSSTNVSTTKDDVTSSSSFSFGIKKDTPAAGFTGALTQDFSFVGAPSKPPVTSGFSFVKSHVANAMDSKDIEPKKPAVVPTFMSKPTEEKPIPSFTFGAAINSTGAAAAPKSVTGGFSFGAAATSAPSPHGLSFGATKTKGASTDGFAFNLTAPNSGTAASRTPFSFGGASATPVPTARTNGDGGEEDEESIGREEATVILKSDNPDEDCVFEVEKAKIIEFRKDEKRWADKGTHPLKLLVNKDTKNARILVRNEIGKIVLNTALYKGLVVKPHEAKGKKVGALLALQVDAAITQFILKVSGEKVDAFLSALEDATPK